MEITPAGKKNWRMAYRRPHTKKNNQLSFGDYPQVALAEARTKCLAAQKLLKEGIDPATERGKQKRVVTESARHSFEAITRKWHNTR